MKFQIQAGQKTFFIDIEAGQLTDEFGQLQPVSAKPWALLCYFAQNSGRLLSKEELIEHVWEQSAVTDEAISATIRILRKVLRDDPQQPEFVVNVHGRGYRFAASVSTIPSGEHTNQPNSDTLPHTRLDDINLYASRVRDLYANLRILTMAKPISLLHIYTPVRLVDEQQRNSARTDKQVTRQLIEGSVAAESVSAIDISRTFPRIVLLGAPGCGKSTFLKFLLMHDLDQYKKGSKLPTLIELNRLRGRDQTIIETLHGILASSNLASTIDDTQRLLAQGHLRLLIDGLDELRLSDRNRVIGEIRNLLREYTTCDFIITCRSASYEFWFDHTHHYEILRFQIKSIISFVKKWFSEDRPKARALLRKITGSRALRELCTNPLMLTIVCISFESGRDVSDNRAEIYQRAIDALLERWDLTRGVERDEIYKGLTARRKEDLLVDLAARTFSAGEVAFREARAVELISKSLEATRAYSPSEVRADARAILLAIASQHGLVDRVSLSHWAFAHLTFQEYLTASYLFRRDASLRNRVAKKYFARSDWREVLLLTACLLPNADEFVLTVLESMTEVGFGAYYIRQLKFEIEQARSSILAKHNESDFLFRDEITDDEPSATPKLSIVERKAETTLDTAVAVLDDYRRNGSQLIFNPFEIVRPRRIMIPFPNFPIVDHSLKGAVGECIGSVFATISKEIGDAAWALVADISNTIIEIDEDLMTPRSGVLYPFYSRIDASVLDVTKKLMSRFTEREMSVLSGRRFVCILPEIVDKCVDIALDAMADANIADLIEANISEASLKNVARLIAKFRPDLEPAVFKNFLQSGARIDTREFARLFEIEFVAMAVERVRDTALHNNGLRVRLEAVAAGELLVEILKGPVVLTPRVRVAALNTLHNIVTGRPDPPSGPFGGGIGQRIPPLRVASG